MVIPIFQGMLGLLIQRPVWAMPLPCSNRLVAPTLEKSQPPQGAASSHLVPPCVGTGSQHALFAFNDHSNVLADDEPACV